MTSDDRYLEIRSADDVRVRGTRVGIEHLLSAYLEGSQPEEIALEFPSVSLEQVHGVIAWYLGNRVEADAHLKRWQGRAQEARRQQSLSAQPEVILRLRDLTEQRVVE
jgi:uncharacterized protein (DUF433 family)